MNTPDNLGAASPADRYELVEVLAQGRMAVLCRAVDRDLGRQLAIKVLSEEFRDHPDIVRRFVEEAQIVSQLQHPGIPPVHDIGRLPDGRPYFTMKLVKGRTLAALLAERADPAADRPRFLAVALQMCQVVAYAHAKGVIHRDLKPANVVVGAFGEVQVMDWGLAYVLPGGDATEKEQEPAACVNGIDCWHNHDDHTRRGPMLGTLPYVSPEQARGELKHVDRRSDVFGLGAILCEVLTGQLPFIGTSKEVKVQAQTGDLGPAQQRLEASGADMDLMALVRSCLSARPEDRPAHAGEVANLLAEHCAGATRGR